MIVAAYNETGLTVFAVIRNSALQFADVVLEAMESYDAGSIGDYDIPATEIGATGEYWITWPSWLAVGLYTIQFTTRAGGSPAVSDLPNRFSVSSWYWDGVSLVPDWAIKLVNAASPVAGSPEAQIDAIAVDVAGLDGAAMRGTDGANTVAPDNANIGVAATQATNAASDAATIKGKLPAGGALMHAAGAAVAKSPATLAAADVSGNLPADVKAWNGGALPTVGTSTFDPTTQEVTPTAASKTGYALTSAERNSIAAALLDLANGVETGATVRQALQRMAAVIAGKASGAGSGTETFKGLDGTTTRATVTADTSGNRTGVAYD